VTPGRRPPISWKRHITAAFTDHLALKASAVLVSVAMWFLVAAREPTEEVVSVRFAPQLDSALVMRDPPPMIRALVIGRASEILKLTNSPLIIRRPIASDAPDTLVLPLRTSDVEVPDGAEVIVRDVQPHSLTLRFETTAHRQVPVRSALVVRDAPGAPVRVRLDPESVTVLGPRRAIARMRFVSTVADSVTADTLPRLVDLDTAGLGVTVRPPQVKALFTRQRSLP
jgi:hypothetical protein